jgi:hypothetical protein
LARKERVEFEVEAEALIRAWASLRKVVEAEAGKS